MAREPYDLVVDVDSLQEPLLAPLWSLLDSSEFHAAVQSLGGHGTEETGLRIRQEPGLSADAYKLIDFLFMNSSMPSGPSSRPMPERLIPPNGRSACDPPALFRYTMPASICSATRRARS